ncbi:MAG: hypothetical protein IPP40_16175 [bacterium]|nr:hypothetical protein [bacterium]
MTDQQGIITFVNPAFPDLYGYAAQTKCWQGQPTNTRVPKQRLAPTNPSGPP